MKKTTGQNNILVETHSTAKKSPVGTNLIGMKQH